MLHSTRLILRFIVFFALLLITIEAKEADYWDSNFQRYYRELSSIRSIGTFDRHLNVNANCSKPWSILETGIRINDIGAMHEARRVISNDVLLPTQFLNNNELKTRFLLELMSYFILIPNTSYFRLRGNSEWAIRLGTELGVHSDSSTKTSGISPSLLSVIKSADKCNIKYNVDNVALSERNAHHQRWHDCLDDIKNHVNRKIILKQLNETLDSLRVEPSQKIAAVCPIRPQTP